MNDIEILSKTLEELEARLEWASFSGADEETIEALTARIFIVEGEYNCALAGLYGG